MAHYTWLDSPGSIGSDSAGSVAPVAAPREAAAGGAPLGTIARFASLASQCGEFWGVDRQVHRFALQSAARVLVPRERVALCLRRPIPLRSCVDVLYAPAVQSAHYGGLQVCGSVWMCPVCSAKITERRRLELSAGLVAAPGRSILVTFTLQHNVSEALSVVLDSLLGAYRALRSGKWWPAFADRFGVFGSIRALEPTYGQAGWHPHLHVLMFLRGELAIIPFETALKERWSHVLARFGRYASWDHGVDVRFSDADIANYVAKFGRESEWTVAHELAKAPVKVGRAGGRSPQQLLADYLTGDEASGRLWLQYAVNFKGRKQLVWSRGLRGLLGLVDEEKSDEEIAAEQDEVAVVLASLTLDQWRVVLANDIRAELLRVAAHGDVDRLAAFLAQFGVELTPAV